MICYINKLLTGRKMNRIALVFAFLMFSNVKLLWAEGPPVKSSMTNPVVVAMVILMAFLVIIIGTLAYILLGAAEIKFKKWQDSENKNKAAQITTVLIGALLIAGNPVFAQTPSATVETAANSIAGLSPTTFYIMCSIICFELIIIFALLINIRSLIKAEKAKVFAAAGEAVPKKKTLSWWAKLNKFRPAEQEADIDLGHDYDGIRELDNRLPPWWLYGFYITIVFGAIYLYRYHVVHSAPLSGEEYRIAVEKADLEVKAYLKQKGETVDENTVTMLGKDDIDAGKNFFKTSCVACHNEGGAGNVGPNLTDDYWLHGGDIKNIFKTIKYGFGAMPSWQNTYSNKQVAQLASYVKSLHGTNPPNPKAPQGELYKEDGAVKTDSAAAKKDTVAAKHS